MTGKKLLIIGNGFDKAHDLPTSYSDFLDFAIGLASIYYREDEDIIFVQPYEKYASDFSGNKLIVGYLSSVFPRVQKHNGEYTLNDEYLDEASKIIKHNVWFTYLIRLYEDKKMRGDNWIDFEAEISNIIQWIDMNFERIDTDVDDIYEVIQQSSILEKVERFFFENAKRTNECSTLGQLIDLLYDDLEKMIKVLDLYLFRFVEKTPVRKRNDIELINPDMVISFNYTHTFRRIYSDSIPICHIHGECGFSGFREKCNMVIGINEYLDEEQRNKKTNMAVFKKFLQRIRNKNDIRYMDWINEMESLFKQVELLCKVTTDYDDIPTGISDVYIYGHSLDITDEDILRLFLKPMFTNLMIYAYRKVDEGKLYSNVLRIIEYKTFIEKVYHDPQLIEMRIIEEK